MAVVEEAAEAATDPATVVPAAAVAADAARKVRRVSAMCRLLVGAGRTAESGAERTNGR
ncbi:hypothetical protein GCM10009744_40270 [Kribbella alba]|uniref:Uncharacterized protein n=1 Tax=Kribbella alba TaxID=190197 RepID=A0ABP4REF3_9ACTN